ncbi:organic solvent tolerance protein OstA [Bacteroidia bacterium]|nr:organic solvent tolerance protein OstA [Bacteroidia bacterium]
MIVALCSSLHGGILHAQTNDTLPSTDSLQLLTDTAVVVPKKVSKNAIEARVDYKAKDSITFDFKNNKAYLYNKAQVNYQSIQLESGEISINFLNQELRAIPITDTAGGTSQIPHYHDQTQDFDANEMIYNFKSGKAKVKNIVTKENELFVHGQTLKKMPDNVTYSHIARFTSCDLEHPHFYIVTKRAKIIPNDKIVTGGAMLFLNDMPTPLALPFTLIPNSIKKVSGILFPTYGESQRQGFFLQKGGFYWHVNDYLSWTITGDIFTRGDWTVSNAIRYRKRYKFNGNLNVEYGLLQNSDPIDVNYSRNKSLSVSWQHIQDAKANPNSVFSANVSFFNRSSQTYNTDLANVFQNQSNSSISYSRNKLFGLFNFTSSASLNYNVNTSRMDASLPSTSLSLLQPIYPFRRKSRIGDAKWYESFKITYNLVERNDVSTADTSFWTKENFANMKTGIKHNVSSGMDIKLFKKFINWNHTANYHEYWYTSMTEKGFFDTTNTAQLISERRNGFYTTRDYDYASSLSTTLYGMLNMPRFFLRAVRHQMQPSVSFSLRPDFYTYQSGYRYYRDSLNREFRYNIYEGMPNGNPSGYKSGNIGLSISNTLEAKLRDKKDTVTGEKKIKILEAFSIGTSYNLAADSMNWAPISINVRTMLFKKLQVNYSSSFSMYARDTVGRQINKYVWKEGGIRALLKETERVNLSLSWSLSPPGKDGKETPPPTVHVRQSPFSDDLQFITDRTDFSIPWSLTLSYSFQYNIVYDQAMTRHYRQTLTQTLNVSGDITLTEKWKIAMQSGFDFRERKLSTTSFSFKRDLHCWQMSFNWVPFGNYKEWSFSIKANSSMLSSALKYDKAHSYLENSYQ